MLALVVISADLIIYLAL